MPIYEYRCQACGTQFEELTLSAANASKVACHQCESRRVTRLLSAFAVGSSTPQVAAEPGPCGSCGAAQRGMCGVG